MKKGFMALLSTLLVLICLGMASVTAHAETGSEYALYGFQVVLDSSFDVRVYVTLSEEVAADSSLEMQFQVGNRTLHAKQEGMYGKASYFTCELGSSELTETISADLFFGGSKHHVMDYSVYEYLLTLLEQNKNQDDYAQLENLVDHLLCYAAHSQLYFGRNTKRLANAHMDIDPIKGLSSAQVKAAIEPIQNGSLENSVLRYSGCSLICETDTSLRMYFTKKTDASLQSILKNYPIKLDGKLASEREVDEYGNTIAVTFRQIPVNLLDGIHTVTIGSGAQKLEISCSALGYIRQAMDSDNTKLKNLGKALYLYHKTAKEYEASQTNNEFFVKDGIIYRAYENGLAVVGIEAPRNKVVIPKTVGNKRVIRIDDYAFQDDMVLTTIDLPDSVVSIGEGAFKGCLNLKTMK